MTVYYDGIIENIQSFGGVSNVFENVISFIPSDSYIYFSYDRPSRFCRSNNKIIEKRRFERYRDALLGKQCEGIFHSTYYRIPSNRNNFKVVTTVHDFIYERFESGVRRHIHSYQKYRSVRNSDAIVCVSNSTADDLMFYCGVSHSKIVVIPNACSDKFKFNVVEKNNDVVFVGSRNSRYKNFRLAVEAISLLPDLKLHIVGGGDISGLEFTFLQKLLGSRFKYSSWMDESTFSDILNHSYALIYPSAYEGFGIPIIEAFKSGCPVVIGPTAACIEVSNGAAVVAENYSAQAFANSLKQIAPQKIELIERALVQSQKFSWSSSAGALIDLYSSLS